MALPSESERTIPLAPGAANQWEDLGVKTGADDLAPAVIQDASTRQVLMLGYLNAAAWAQTCASGRVTFYSRSKGRLWTKGESSGHYLELVSAALDCDRDTFLLQVRPHGPVCHTGADTCWAEPAYHSSLTFLEQLESVLRQRHEQPSAGSYTASLFQSGMAKIAQKVGEEAVETVIEALGNDRERLLNESADLLFHLLVLLTAKDLQLSDVTAVLASRQRQ